MAETYRPVPIPVSIETHRIGSGDRAFVVPASIHVGKGATQVPSVMWTNGTKADVKLWFPNGEKLFKPPEEGNFDNPLVIGSGKVRTLYVQDGDDCELHYHVYCVETEDCAHGKSEPTGTRP
jgi:hypothetical protein